MFLLVGVVVPVNAWAESPLALPLALHAVLVLLAVPALPCNSLSVRIILGAGPHSLSAYYEVHLSGSDKADQ